jgi:hypothetical protein
MGEAAVRPVYGCIGGDGTRITQNLDFEVARSAAA